MPASSSPETLSLTRMAAHLGVSRQTFDRWVSDWPDMPMAERGAPGHPHKFDPAAVTEFVKRRRHAEREQRARRGGVPLAAQADLDIQIEETDPDALTTKGKLDAEKLELVRKQVERLTRLEAVARRDLVSVSEMLDALAEALQRLGKANRASVAASCRELNLPDAAARVLERNLGRDQREFVRALPALLGGLSAQDVDGEGAAADA